jgi:hypothetical protein
VEIGDVRDLERSAGGRHRRSVEAAPLRRAYPGPLLLCL